ncbi:MAG TPA: hypothetical protein VGS23_09680 [Thermoplasmata archaeon]|nr:hypothetical protein [Thermoplasmata archaeon]
MAASSVSTMAGASPDGSGAAAPPSLSGPGFAATPPAKPTKVPGRWKVWVVLALTVAIVLGAVGYETLANAGAKPVVLLKDGTGIQIPAGDYYAESFSLGKSAILSGSLVSGDGVIAYVLTPSNYNIFHATGRTSGATWTSQLMFNASFSVALNAGSWDIVFQGSNPQLPTEFLLTSNLSVSPS